MLDNEIFSKERSPMLNTKIKSKRSLPPFLHPRPSSYDSWTGAAPGVAQKIEKLWSHVKSLDRSIALTISLIKYPCCLVSSLMWCRANALKRASSNNNWKLSARVGTSRSKYDNYFFFSHYNLDVLCTVKQKLSKKFQSLNYFDLFSYYF